MSRSDDGNRRDDDDQRDPDFGQDENRARADVETGGGREPLPAVPAEAQSGEVEPQQDRGRSILKEIFQGGSLVSILAIVLSLVLGGLLIAITNERVADAASYFFARPTDTLVAAWEAASNSYVALFQGAIFNPRASDFQGMIFPFTETLAVATPLILAGLGVALAFRAGLFNIGAQGQIIIGATMAAWVGFTLDLPWGVHLLLVMLAGIIGGGLWAGIAGLLKARTGAHEVILTIMLNYIAIHLLQFLLTTESFQRPGASNPISPQLDQTAMYPRLFGDAFRLHWGFIVAIGATVLVWWLLHRSTIGFEFRAVGANPYASKTAGISVAKGYTLVMIIAGALAGLAGVAQVSGTEGVLTDGVAASFGFDAITVALLGRSKPWGTFFAGLLFGAFRAGGVTMQTLTGTPIDIVLVVQSMIVLFIAAPPLVRAIFRIHEDGDGRKDKRRRKSERQTVKAGGAA
ncbi:ABC transporter permease [Arthrobacter castelli]|uniref:ABC transporter permease n=1 Tax=Arthrobacter castelli TaxID=271431 RepID=UPI000407CFD9|nr:ABC transporter permease [Arthrobacter castelli]